MLHNVDRGPSLKPPQSLGGPGPTGIPTILAPCSSRSTSQMLVVLRDCCETLPWMLGRPRRVSAKCIFPFSSDCWRCCHWRTGGLGKASLKGTNLPMSLRHNTIMPYSPSCPPFCDGFFSHPPVSCNPPCHGSVVDDLPIVVSPGQPNVNVARVIRKRESAAAKQDQQRLGSTQHRLLLRRVRPHGTVGSRHLHCSLPSHTYPAAGLLVRVSHETFPVFRRQNQQCRVSQPLSSLLSLPLPLPLSSKSSIGR
ncbi:hypothetical protein F4808DRAFT_218062 [Astrocystis sublimbata]|nr:hypothetical protein F4808DRAFT_218062 [Astrocystis sublimbata]